MYTFKDTHYIYGTMYVFSDTPCNNQIIFQPTQILREINVLIYELWKLALWRFSKLISHKIWEAEKCSNFNSVM